jgi:WD40 repeat protein
MGWPLSQDYNEAVQTPRASFAEADLKAGAVAVGPMGLPLPRSGNFADVYQVRTPDGRTWAVKCFTRPVAGLRERYARIDEHLHQARLPFTVGFRFLTEGIRVRGQWYPVVQMEWVEGFTLNEFVRQYAGRPDMLRALLGMWVRLCKRLRDARIAHADLQHGNVLLVPGETANKLKLRLIDYDGMWVPSLAGKPSGEAGHPAYQHPARLRDKVYSADVDRFPHLVIGCALRAVAVAGKPMFDQSDNGDNLLFRETDFADPGRSKLLRTLWDLDDPTVTNLVALLVTSAQRPVRDTPWLDEVLSGDKAEPVKDAVLAKAAAILGVPRRAARRAAPPAQIYSIPEEANAFAGLLDDADRPRPRRPRRKRKLPLIPLITGGGVVLAAVVVLVLLALRDGKPAAPAGPDTAKGGPAPPEGVEPGPDAGGPVAAVKRGSLETKWSAVEAGPPLALAPALAEGIDTARPGNFVRAYPADGAGALAVRFLPDGARAVLAGRTGIGLLDLKTGKVDPLVAGVELVRATVSPDGRYAVTADKDRVVRGLDLESGQQLFAREFPAAGPVLAVTPDGKRVALTAPGVGYAEWALSDGAEVRRHEALQSTSLAFSPDGKRAVAADEDGTVEVWDLVEGKATVLAADQKASAVGVSPDGKRALAATEAAGRELRSWDLADGRPLPAHPLPVKSPVTAFAVAADGMPVVGTQGGEVVSLPEGRAARIALVANPPGPIAAIALTGDGKHLLAATEQASGYLSRTGARPAPPVTPKVTPKNPPPSPGPPWLEFVRAVGVPKDTTCLAADAAGDRFLVATPTRLIIYDAETFRQRDSFQLAEGQIAAAGFGPGDTVVLTERDAENKYRTRAWDLKAQAAGPAFAVPTPGGIAGQAYRIVPVPNRPWVLASTNTVGDVLFDPKTGKVVPGWPAAKVGDAVTAAADPDGKAIAVGSATDPVRLWDCDTATLGRPFEASAGFYRLAFAPGGLLLGVGQWGRIRVWDVGDRKVRYEVDHDQSGVFTNVAALAGDSDVFAVARAGMWMVVDGPRGKMAGTGDVPDPLAGRGLVIGRRGWILAVGKDDRLVAWKVLPDKVADAPARPPAGSLFPDVRLVRDAPRAPAVGLAFAPGGKWVLSATEAGPITRFTADRLRFDKEVSADEGPLRGMAVAKDKLFTLGRKAVVVRNPDTLEKVAEYPVTIAGSSPPVFAVQPDGNTVLVASDRVRELNLSAKKESVVIAPRAAGGKPLTQFAWSADGKSAVARWGNAVTTVWQPRQTAEARVLEDAKAAAFAGPEALAISDDGRLVALGTRAGELKVWDTKTGKALFSEAGVYKFNGRINSGVESVRFLPGGTHLVTTGTDGQTTLWKVDGFKRVQEVKGPAGFGRVALSPDTRFVVIQQPQYMQLVELLGPIARNR